MGPAERRATAPRAPWDPEVEAQVQRKMERKKFRGGGEMRLALEGKISEDSARQFDEALKNRRGRDPAKAEFHHWHKVR